MRWFATAGLRRAPAIGPALSALSPSLAAVALASAPKSATGGHLRPFAASQALALGNHFEAESAGDRRHLDKLHFHLVAEAIALAGSGTDHGVPRLVEDEELRAQRAHRHEAVGAGIVKFHEQAGARDAGDAPVEGRADAVGKPMRNEPVDRVAFGRHGPALRGRN